MKSRDEAADLELAMINVSYAIKGIWELSAVMQTIANATLEDPRELSQAFKTLATRLHGDADELSNNWQALEKHLSGRTEC